jgi:hypothetical protein
VLELGDIFIFHIDVHSFDDKLSLLPRLLSRIPQAALATVKFEFRITNNFLVYLPSDDNLLTEVTNTDATWMAIDKLLAESFSALTEVVFMVFDCSHRFKIAQYLERRLARCKQRGLLRIFKATRPV